MVAIAAALGLAGSAAASHDGGRFWSGSWATTYANGATGVIAFRWIAAAEGRAAIARFGGTPCADGGDFYRGGWTAGRDAGQHVACTSGATLIGRWNDGRSEATGGFELRVAGKEAWSGTFTTDGEAAQGSWRGAFRNHFKSDGAAPEDPKRIQDTAEYREFLGLDDPPRSGWQGWIQERCADVPALAAALPEATVAAEIPGESLLGKHSANLLYPGGSDLFVLLAKSEPPNDLSPQNVFATVTRQLEVRLKRKILQSGGGLLPADVLRMALEVTAGSYPLATLTAHNLLKNLTVVGRETIREARQASAKAFERNRSRWLRKIEIQTRVVNKLQNLRADPPKSRDKMGPWYHTFAVLAAGALTDSTTANTIVLAEHGAKLAGFFLGVGGFNKEKYAIDRCVAAVTSDPRLEALSRYDVI